MMARALIKQLNWKRSPVKWMYFGVITEVTHSGTRVCIHVLYISPSYLLSFSFRRYEMLFGHGSMADIGHVSMAVIEHGSTPDIAYGDMVKQYN
jgi:hypothetical protein